MAGGWGDSWLQGCRQTTGWAAGCCIVGSGPDACSMYTNCTHTNMVPRGIPLWPPMVRACQGLVCVCGRASSCSTGCRCWCP